MEDRIDKPITLKGLVESAVEGVGGVEALGSMLAENISRVSQKASEESLDSKGFHRTSRLMLDHISEFRRMIQEKDRLEQENPMRHLTDEQLREMMAPLAIELMRNDTEFRAEILAIAARDLEEMRLLEVYEE